MDDGRALFDRRGPSELSLGRMAPGAHCGSAGTARQGNQQNGT